MNQERKEEIRKCLEEIKKAIKQSDKVVNAVKKEMKEIEHQARLNIMKLRRLL